MSHHVQKEELGVIRGGRIKDNGKQEEFHQKTQLKPLSPEVCRGKGVGTGDGLQTRRHFSYTLESTC